MRALSAFDPGDNPYAVGEAVDSGTDDVKELFDSQSAMGALLGGASGAIISVVCFEAIAIYLSAQLAATGLIVFGIIVGLAVRIMGRGFELMYRLIAVYFTFVAQVWLVLRVIALWFGLAAIFVGMLLGGLTLAGALCVRRLNATETMMAWRARNLGTVPDARFVNTWAFVATLMLLTGAPLVYIVSFGILWLFGIQVPWQVVPGL